MNNNFNHSNGNPKKSSFKFSPILIAAIIIPIIFIVPITVYGAYSIYTEYGKDYFEENENKEYIFPKSDVNYLTDKETSWLYDQNNLSTVRLTINEIYARHGMIFRTEENYNYFNSKSWYKPNSAMISEDQVNKKLSNIEKMNIKTLLRIESDLENNLIHKGDNGITSSSTEVKKFEKSVELFSNSDYLLPTSQFMKLNDNTLKHIEDIGSITFISLAINEIYARHGLTFKNSENKDFFESKNWYDPDSSLNSGKQIDEMLSDEEKYNVNALYDIKEALEK